MESAKQKGEKAMVAKREQLITDMEAIRLRALEFDAYNDLTKMEEVMHWEKTPLLLYYGLFLSLNDLWSSDYA